MEKPVGIKRRNVGAAACGNNDRATCHGIAAIFQYNVSFVHIGDFLCKINKYKPYPVFYHVIIANKICGNLCMDGLCGMGNL